MKKELDLKDLEKVLGGFKNENCPYFVQALRSPYLNKCENCRYYNQNEDNIYACSHPSKNEEATKL